MEILFIYIIIAIGTIGLIAMYFFRIKNQTNAKDILYNDTIDYQVNYYDEAALELVDLAKEMQKPRIVKLAGKNGKKKATQRRRNVQVRGRSENVEESKSVTTKTAKKVSKRFKKV